MSVARTLLSEVFGLRIVLREDSGELKVRGPKEVITPEIVQQIGVLKPEILAILDCLQRARRHIDRIRSVTDDPALIALLVKLDDLITFLTTAKPGEAVALAEEIADRCMSEKPLEGQVLAAKIHEIFGMEAPKPAA